MDHTQETQFQLLYFILYFDYPFALNVYMEVLLLFILYFKPSSLSHLFVGFQLLYFRLYFDYPYILIILLMFTWKCYFFLLCANVQFVIC